jgi:hypothetical protein
MFPFQHRDSVLTKAYTPRYGMPSNCLLTFDCDANSDNSTVSRGVECAGVFWYAPGMKKSINRVAAGTAVEFGKVTAFVDRQNAERLRVPFSAVSAELVQIDLGDWALLDFHKDWTAAARVVTQNGQPVIGEIRILPRQQDPADSFDLRSATAPVPDGGLTVRVYRKVKLRDITSLAFSAARSLALLAAHGAIPHDHPAAAVLANFFPAMKKMAKTKRERKPDLFYTLMAAKQLDLVDRGVPKPNVELARAYGVPASKIRDGLSEARRRELLTHPIGPGGKAGGVLTPKAINLLQQYQASIGKKTERKESNGRQRSTKKR